LSLTSVSPSSGRTAGGTSVTITGTNLAGATAVTFCGTRAANVTVQNATTKRCRRSVVFTKKNTEAYQVIIHRPGKEGDQRNFHAHSLRAKLKGMLNGLEAEVALVVDVMLSTERLVDAIRAFEREFPTVALRLHVEALAHRNK
jgi:hypothetical protein